MKYQGRWTSLRPTFVLRRVQVAPASSERKRPPSSASTRAHTREGRAGDTATPILPTTPLGRPPSNRFQVSPPSSVLKRPHSSLPDTMVQGLRWPVHAA